MAHQAGPPEVVPLSYPGPSRLEEGQPPPPYGQHLSDLQVIPIVLFEVLSLSVFGLTMYVSR